MNNTQLADSQLFMTALRKQRLLQPRPHTPWLLDPARVRYSHSIVAGGLLVMSSTTRFTSSTSLVIRVLIVSSTS